MSLKIIALESAYKEPSLFGKILSMFDAKERQHATVLMIMLLLGAVLEAIGVGLLFPVISVLAEPARIPETYIIGNIFNALGQPRIGRFVLGILFMLLLVFFVKNTYLAVLSYWQNRFANDKQAALSQKLFASYLSQPYSFHIKRNSAESLRNMTTESNSLVRFVILPILMLFAESLTVIALILLLLLNNVIAASLIIILFSGTSFIFYRLVRVRILRWGEEHQKHDGLCLQHLQQGLGGIKDITLLGRQAFFKKRYIVDSNLSATYAGLQGFISNLPLLWLETLAVAVLLGLVAILLLQGNDFGVIIPTLGMFTAAAFRLMPSVNRILVSLQNLRYCQPTVDVLYREINLGTAIDSQSGNHSTNFLSRIELKNVSFKYPGAKKDVFQNFSLVINKGESVGIVGQSGSGKTTVVDILLGLLQPTAGELLVDGQPVLAASWQQNIGYVPQNIYLTDDTLYRNIAFGLPDELINETQVWRAVEAAQLGDYVHSLPEGLATVVGERGVRLSGGQRQRIAIARALYNDPEVLVLDEATSALDSETEAAVVSAITCLHGKKTIVVIAHRLSTLKGCDRVIAIK